MAAKNYDYLVIGGGIAGVSAAEAIRERDGAGTIAIISSEPHLPYSRVLLPSYLKKRIPRERVFFRAREHFAENRIDFLAGDEVAGVDTGGKRVFSASGAVFGYGKLLIAAGGRAAPWGRDEEQNYLYRLQTLDHADRLFAALPALRAPAVIGSSFISLEFLEIFLLSGASPCVIARGPHFFSSMLDARGGALLADNLVRHGVALHFNDEIKEVAQDGSMLLISTRGGQSLRVDALTAGVGITRNTEFLKNSGIVLGERGVLTNEFLETNVSDVYAAGDIAQMYDPVPGTHRVLGNWTSALLQGKHTGLAMTGVRQPYEAVPSYSITNLGFQITALGDCDPALQTIVRSYGPKNQYERFFMRGGVLAGAFLINCFADKPHLAQLIAKRIPLAPYRVSLAEAAFDIRTIPLIP